MTARVEFSMTGQLVGARFPREDTVYDAFLFNKSSGIDYSLIENHPNPRSGTLTDSPNMLWHREDHFASWPDEIPREALSQISNVLIPSWATYMTFTEMNALALFG